MEEGAVLSLEVQACLAPASHDFHETATQDDHRCFPPNFVARITAPFARSLHCSSFLHSPASLPTYSTLCSTLLLLSRIPFGAVQTRTPYSHHFTEYKYTRPFVNGPWKPRPCQQHDRYKAVTTWSITISRSLLYASYYLQFCVCRMPMAPSPSLVALFFALIMLFSTVNANSLPWMLKRQNALIGTGASKSTAPAATSSLPSTTSDQAPASTTLPPSTSTTLTSTAAPTTSDAPNPTSNSATATTSASAPSNTQATSASSRTSSASASKTTNKSSSSDAVVVIGSGSAATTINRSTISSPTTITSALVSSSTQRYTTTIVTVIDGSSFTTAVPTEKVVASTTGFATATVLPSLNDGGSNGSSAGGLSTSSKKIIGGVVGGIGGAILLGGLALVAWRMWGRRHANGLRHEEDDLPRPMTEKNEPPLSRYHNGGQINTASNF
jgi:hypothetical protein